VIQELADIRLWFRQNVSMVQESIEFIGYHREHLGQVRRTASDGTIEAGGIGSPHFDLLSFCILRGAPARLRHRIQL
jgi:hypothetical protein